MPKRGRRSGVSFIEDGRGRGLTFFKRRSGLFKAASDLSTLTGVRVAVVLESENERFSSFGTPDASPIVDAFLLGGVPTESDTSGEQKAKITNLRNELFHLEKENAMADKRQKKNMVRIKEVQMASHTAKYAYGKEEDLDATKLYEMYRKLTWVMQEIKDCSPTLLRANHVEAGGRLRDPSLLQPKWWCSSPASQFAPPPPKYFPLSLSQASFQQHQWSSMSHPMLARSGSSSFPNPLMLPSQQMQSELQQHPLSPHAPSIARPQAPQPKEAYPYNYHIHGLDIKCSSPGLNADLGNTGGNGGQTGGGHSRGFDLSTTQQSHGGAGVMLESSSAGESSGAGNAAGSNLGDFNFPCY
ncbi:transcription factor RLM1-like [Panicum miliaceum]|uniref:Transcription factor RLM1-like n=1 Tax=Panicum miliaceum TaxID=4540 RepID=A0A3L6SRH8_PANMI|nr:transcription factor RLM1-like [Panicum miliaceum]